MPEPNGSTCQEAERLFKELKTALKRVVEVQSCQIAALKSEGGQVVGFDEEIRVAIWAWQHARHAYMEHVLVHECSSAKDLI